VETAQSKSVEDGGRGVSGFGKRRVGHVTIANGHGRRRRRRRRRWMASLMSTSVKGGMMMSEMNTRTMILIFVAPFCLQSPLSSACERRRKAV
jgi:hypothetical protein